MTIVPVVVGRCIVTVAPHTGHFFGSFTGALFTGLLPILAVFYVCMGVTIDVRALPIVLRRGGTLLATKIVLGIMLCRLLGESRLPLAGSRGCPRSPSWRPSTTPTMVCTWC